MANTVTPELVQQEERRDRSGRRHLPRERQEQLLAAFRESGLTRVACAKREGISYTTFCHWTQQAAKSGKAIRAATRLPAMTNAADLRPLLPAHWRARS